MSFVFAYEWKFGPKSKKLATFLGNKCFVVGGESEYTSVYNGP